MSTASTEQTEQTERAGAPPPHVALQQMVFGFGLSQSIYVAAQLGIADLLTGGPRTSDELAAGAGAHPASLSRLLRLLAGVGLFAEDERGRFHLTPLSEPLVSGPGSMRSMVLHLGEGPTWAAWGDLLHSVRTGETAFAHAHGAEVFLYYAAHPESNRYFNDAMTEFSGAVIPEVVRAYDFSAFGKIVDVGGGHGHLLSAILDAAPQAGGVLFDQPATVEAARRHPGAATLAGRCEYAGGDFFESVPEGGDAYVLKWIIHDWDDARARVILGNVRRAMADEGRLLLVESVIAGGEGSALAKLSDIHMMVMTGGCERTEGEYRALLASAGFELTRIVPTRSPFSLVEAVKGGER